MAFYWNVVFPRLCDWAMNQPHVARRRRQLLAAVDGAVLEIGIGTGLNLPQYPAQVRKIAAVDPNPGMVRLLRERIKQTGIEVDQRTVGSERLPFDEATFDCAVSTWTLCSVDDVERVLGELHRVLKPGGRFIFLEHGLSDNAKIRTWQRRLNWLQRRIAGCRLDLNVRELLARQPFRSVEVANFYLEKTPAMLGYMYQGVATK